jgi:hypothetical protein
MPAEKGKWKIICLVRTTGGKTGALPYRRAFPTVHLPVAEKIILGQR